MRGRIREDRVFNKLFLDNKIEPGVVEVKFPVLVEEIFKAQFYALCVYPAGVSVGKYCIDCRAVL